MKVALISHTFPPNMTGGIGTYTFDLAEYLTKRGIDVTVFCGGKVDKELEHNFKIKRLPMFNFPPRAVWFQVQNYRYFKRELKDFDIIHGQNTSSTFFTFLKNKIKKPWIVTFHDYPKRGLNAFFDSPRNTRNFGDFMFNVLEYPLYKKLCDIDIKKSDKIISVGASLRDDLLRYSNLNKDKSIVINNGINIEKINKICNDTKRYSSKKIKLIFFGRLFYGKGITFLIDAMKQVVIKEKNIQLDIYGEGPLKKVVEKQIIENNLIDYVKLHNFIPNKEVIKEVYNSDIVILPSLYEAFPLAYLEVMACGKPLITFDYPFAREIIKNNKNGILVKSKDSKELAKEIINLAKNKELRAYLGRSAYKSIKERFNLNNVVDKYINVYKEVLKEK